MRELCSNGYIIDYFILMSMNQNYQVVPAFMQDCMEQSIANAQDAIGLEICSLLTFTCHSSFPTYFLQTVTGT